MATATLNVRITGPLADFVADRVGPFGRYENASEYVRDLIRRDLEEREVASFAELKAELQRAFATPDCEYTEWDVEAFLAEVRTRAA